jgi:hypothetical protein
MKVDRATGPGGDDQILLSYDDLLQPDCSAVRRPGPQQTRGFVPRQQVLCEAKNESCPENDIKEALILLHSVSTDSGCCGGGIICNTMAPTVAYVHTVHTET